MHNDLILGLKFLEQNSIVVDPETWSATDKKTEFDLLHPPDPVESRKRGPVALNIKHQEDKKAGQVEREWIRKGHKETESLWRAVHSELVGMFAKNAQGSGKGKEHSTTGEPMVLGLVRSQIEELAFVEKLKSMDAKMKK
ncbi:hypothetical protein C0995_003015, partial [Termitomyces sp. Mi166